MDKDKIERINELLRDLTDITDKLYALKSDEVERVTIGFRNNRQNKFTTANFEIITEVGNIMIERYEQMMIDTENQIFKLINSNEDNGGEK